MSLFSKSFESDSFLSPPESIPTAGGRTKERIGQLDSLRGVAALTVLIGHFTNIFPEKLDGSNIWWNIVFHSPLICVMAGHQAVIFFFVLSGFVLSLPFYQRTVPYTPWMVKRFCRIYFPYYGAMLLTMLLAAYCVAGPIPSLSEWFNNSFQQPIDGRVIFDHLLLMGSFDNWEFNPVVWFSCMDAQFVDISRADGACSASEMVAEPSGHLYSRESWIHFAATYDAVGERLCVNVDISAGIRRGMPAWPLSSGIEFMVSNIWSIHKGRGNNGGDISLHLSVLVLPAFARTTFEAP